MEKFYVIFVWRDIIPGLHGPFFSVAERDKKAKEVREKEGKEHGIFQLNIDRNGKPDINSYPSSFFKEKND